MGGPQLNCHRVCFLPLFFFFFFVGQGGSSAAETMKSRRGEMVSQPCQPDNFTGVTPRRLAPPVL